MAHRRTWRQPSPTFWPALLTDEEHAGLPDALLLATVWRERAEAWVLAHGDGQAGDLQKVAYRLHGLFVYNQVVEDRDVDAVPPMAGAPPWMARLYALLRGVQAWVREEEAAPTPREAPRDRRPGHGTSGGRRTIFGRGYGVTSASKVARALGMVTQRGPGGLQANGWVVDASGVPTRTVRGAGTAGRQGRDEITVSFALAGHDATLTAEERQSLADMAGGLSDLDHDVLDIMLAHHREHRDEDGYTRLAVETILRERGLAPKRTVDEDGRRRAAGYRADEVARHAACLDRLLHMEVRLRNVEIYRPVAAGTLRRRGDGKTWLWSIACPAFEWQRLARAGADGVEVTREVRYRPTQWHEPFAAQTMRLPREVLRYDPEGGKWEKRIARYLLRQARINAHKGDSANAYRSATEPGGDAAMVLHLHRQVGTVLRETSLLDLLDRRNPQKARLRFEKALERLRADHVIAGWGYTAEAQETLRAMPRQGWLDEYWLPCTVWVAVDQAED